MSQAGTPKIVMKFDALGGIDIDAQCFVGGACKEATAVFEQAFAGGRRKEEDKPELSGGASSGNSQYTSNAM